MNINTVAMITLSIVQIPALFCAMLVLVQFVQRSGSLRRLQNHLLICLLFFATYTIIIDLPNTQKYLWTGSVTIKTHDFCIFWTISFSVMESINRFLTALMSIERHLFVFHPQFHRTPRSRFVFHYSPPIIIIGIIFVYFIITNVYVKCSSNFDYSAFMCGYTCAILSESYGTFSVWFFAFTPTLVTVIASTSLPIRFLIQKRHVQRIRWARARKMIIQTILITGAFTVFWIPYIVVLQLLINRRLSIMNQPINLFLAYTPYITSLLTPFIVLHAVSTSIHLPIIEVIKRRLFSKIQATVQRISTVSRPPGNHINTKHNTKDETSL